MAFMIFLKEYVSLNYIKKMTLSILTGKKTMDDKSSYTPPKVWLWESPSGGKFENINRPIAGETHEKELPIGRHPLQLYSLATPNGVKVTVMLEELLLLGKEGAEYDAYLIDINEGDQFGSGFVEINPNSKIPALVDRSGKEPVHVFESGAILLYLAEKFGALIPDDPRLRANCLSWLFWQMGSAPYLGGGFGHFYSYAPEKFEYPINRFAMEVKRQMDVLDRHLADNHYFCGNEYSIADIAIWPWYGNLVLNRVYEAAEFLDASSYTHLIRWTKEIRERPAVQRGRMVNRRWGEPEDQLRERHDAADFDTRTQDKLEPNETSESDEE
jgi:GSH-dependent disulfide-bond oxidoreductase